MLTDLDYIILNNLTMMVNKKGTTWESQGETKQLSPCLAGVSLPARGGAGAFEQLRLLLPVLGDVPAGPQHEVEVVLGVDGVVDVGIWRDL